ncbi:MAG: hypothetical protein IJZ68_06840 [Bacteroidaceae bacterium]|nr:hypothetical protein [Bacteroidaceae bacterium]
MKKCIMILVICALAISLTACDMTAAKQTLKEEFPYFFCEIDPPNPI